MSQKHHILLLGGTGLCGQVFTRAALEAGHRLTLYARSPSKLAPDLASHANITIIEGQLDNVDGLTQAASCGADVFISLAGPTLGKREGTVGFASADLSLLNQILIMYSLAYNQHPQNPLPPPPHRQSQDPHSLPLDSLLQRPSRSTQHQMVHCNQWLRTHNRRRLVH